MKEIILILAEVVNVWHDVLLDLTRVLGWDLSDKDLHFWVIGILGLIALLFVDTIFHALSKLSISAISFLFTFSMVLVFVFAVEIQQKITGRGNMEFGDAAASIFGFLVFCIAYFMVRLLWRWVQNFRRKQPTS
ncbi:hypothetical protein [Halobacillus halophilus]|uniref:hypothetical protein n=1 Tax=Halobacillus halophilus TaxID=1570 RepID=UPI001CD7A892|nr:hypothetical protein [Halobacillus halophilus]MCA1010835.1 hypothetical protein [Halobacillus halophilus]